MLLLLAAFAAACTTSGIGVGTTGSGAGRITFDWKSRDAVSGTLIATLPDGTAYRGRYFQIRQDTKADNLASLFDGWHSGWDETDWNTGPTPDFIAHYSDQILANLDTPGGSHMRCKFQLAFPSNGLLGGGGGQCQLPGGTTIEVKFPAE
jgi:hypothetical protein